MGQLKQNNTIASKQVYSDYENDYTIPHGEEIKYISLKKFYRQNQKSVSNRVDIPKRWERVFINEKIFYKSQTSKPICPRELMGTNTLNANVNLDDSTERFTGFVETITDGTAYVRLTAENGDILYGKYPSQDLIQKGVMERSLFELQIINSNNSLSYSIAPIKEKKISNEVSNNIWMQIKKITNGQQNAK